MERLTRHSNVSIVVIGLVIGLVAIGCASSPKSGSSKSRSASKSSRSGGVVQHVVRPGENLWRISKYYGVDTKSLIKANRIKNVKTLQVGQRLVIPGASKGQPGNSVANKAAAENARSVATANRAQALRESKLEFSWPVAGNLSSRFGWRSGRQHEGIDIPAKKGTPIRAAEAGRVVHSGELSAYGYVVIVKHAGKYSTVYAHNRKNKVKKGQFVEKGDTLATVGKSGNASGYHLHFELRRSRIALDPVNFLPVVRFAKGGTATGGN